MKTPVLRSVLLGLLGSFLPPLPCQRFACAVTRAQEFPTKTLLGHKKCPLLVLVSLLSAPAVLLAILLTILVIPTSARAQELYFSGRMECFTIGNPPSLAIVETIICPNNSNVVQCNNVQVVGEYFTTAWQTLGTKTFNTLSPGQRADFTIVGGYKGGTRCRVRLVSGDVVLTSHGICDRTPQVRDKIVELSPVSTCSAVTEAHLAAITELILGSQQIRTLKVDDFDGLNALTRLYLPYNQLTSLPAGIFDELNALTRLELERNQLASLPADIFDGLNALTEIDLRSNQLTSLPAGIFDGLNSLKTLRLHSNRLTSLPAGIFDGLNALTLLNLLNNSVDPLPLAVSLEKIGEDQFKAVAPTGAPFDIVLPLRVTNGSISGGTTTITIPIGSVESAPLTVTRTPGTTFAVTVDIGTLPGVPRSGHGGYALVKSSNLPLEMFSRLAGAITPSATAHHRCATRSWRQRL